MLGIGEASGPAPKCFFTHAFLPQTIDEKHPPTKRKPFSSILENPHNHTVDVLVRQQDHTNFLAGLQRATGDQRYARVHLKLKDLIEEEFFDRYIKSGNILLLSEGTPGVDNVYALNDGILRLELDKPTYERAGLAGKPVPSPGRKHTKSRYAIDLNLRLPSMVRGKSLYNRMIYAFSHALTETKTWLFYDPEDPALDLADRPSKRQKVAVPDLPPAITPAASDLAEASGESRTANPPDDSKADGKIADNDNATETVDPLTKHQPLLFSLDTQTTSLPETKTPAFPDRLTSSDQQEATDLLEWLGLAMLPSPRLRHSDRSDGTLSRYQVPDLISYLSKDTAEVQNAADQLHGQDTSDDASYQDDDTNYRLDDHTGVDIDMPDRTPLQVYQAQNGMTSPRHHGDANGDERQRQIQLVQDLSRIRYHGFMPSLLVSRILISVIRTVREKRTWAALRVQSFGGKKVMVLASERKAMVWEY
ncbi:Hypothetical protein D9617_21g098030 [Elsinoe fawcettii]|nr:Hypothetical protein D9617_21g098030 [Elsinoe fawcettii]